MERKKVLVIGGGFTGLAAAYELSKKSDFSITLIESSAQLGGLAAGFPLLGTSLEKAYHHLFLTDISILNLVEELELKDNLMWCPSSVGIFRGGKIYPFMSPRDLLRYTPCSFIGRLRMGFTALYLKHKKNWRTLVPRRAYEWMTQMCGHSAMETVWGPLLKGKFNRYYDSVSMAWLWARIHIRANSRSPGGEKLGYFRGGFNVVISALETELKKRGVEIATGTRMDRFADDERAAIVNGKKMQFDFCVFTGPSAAFANLLPTNTPLDNYAARLRSIEYLGAVCMIFTSGQSLGDFYWLNINEPDAPFLVFINHTKLVDATLYRGKNVYYIGAYVPQDGTVFSMPDDELSGQWFRYLKKIFPAFDTNGVGERYIFRFQGAQHIVDTNYEQKIPDYRTPLPGVFLSNFSQVFPEDRGTNFAVREGLKIAEIIQKEANN